VWRGWGGDTLSEWSLVESSRIDRDAAKAVHILTQFARFIATGMCIQELRAKQTGRQFNVTGRAMSQVLSRRNLTAEACVQSQAIPCGICGGKSGIGTGYTFFQVLWFSRSTNDFIIYLFRTYVILVTDDMSGLSLPSIWLESWLRQESWLLATFVTFLRKTKQMPG
jgi:hypothetical protein